MFMDILINRYINGYMDMDMIVWIDINGDVNQTRKNMCYNLI